MSSNADAFAALDAHIASVERLEGLAREAAPDAAKALEKAFQRQIAAGTDAEGKPWQRREDGGQPLQDAAKALTVVAVGTTVVAQLRGYIARHHRGIARGGVVRSIFPTAGLPADLARAVRGALVAKFQQITGGR